MVSSSSSSSSNGKHKSLKQHVSKKKLKKTSSSTKTPSLKIVDENSKKKVRSSVKKPKGLHVKKHKAIKISAMMTTNVQEVKEVNNSVECNEKKTSPQKNKLKKQLKSTKRTIKQLSSSLSSTLKDESSSSPTHSLNQAKLNEFNYLNSRLDDLNAQLGLLKSHNIDLFSDSSHPELKQYINQINELECESVASMQSLTFFYDKKVCDIEREYECDTNKAREEFLEKRTELKETLKQEQEEMRKKCTEIGELSINYDDEAFMCSSHAKRKLRRRGKNVNLNIDHLLDSPPEFGQYFK
jgi:hypothetical protein